MAATQPGAGRRLEQLHVAVVGAGRIGAELMRNLGLMGVGRIDVYEIDRDTADPLRSRYAVFDGDFWDELTLARLQSYDFAVCTIDDRAARVRLNQKCLVANVNLLQVWTEGSLAVVGAYPFGALPDCACFECDSKRGATPMPIAALRLSVAEARGGATPATDVATASVAGALGAALIARVAAAAHGSVARRATLDATLGQGTSVELQRDPDCTRCRALERPVPIVQTRNRWSPSSALARTCPEALDQSVRLSDEVEGFPDGACRIGQLVERFQGGPIPAKFALAEVGARTICLDFEELRPEAPGAAATRSAVQRRPSN
ncbi:MAG TPA: ThiF family adenylyltransferase [Steroidobacteraceae bacterium]